MAAFLRSEGRARDSGKGPGCPTAPPRRGPLRSEAPCPGSPAALRGGRECPLAQQLAAGEPPPPPPLRRSPYCRGQEPLLPGDLALLSGVRGVKRHLPAVPGGRSIPQRGAATTKEAAGGFPGRAPSPVRQASASPLPRRRLRAPHTPRAQGSRGSPSSSALLPGSPGRRLSARHSGALCQINNTGSEKVGLRGEEITAAHRGWGWGLRGGRRGGGGLQVLADSEPQASEPPPPLILPDLCFLTPPARLASQALTPQLWGAALAH